MKKLIFIFALLVSSLCFAAVPQQINYSGNLTRPNGTPLDTTVAITFKLYTDSTAGTLLWTETRASVVVNDGLFNVKLGQGTALTDAIINQAQLWLGIQVGADAEMTPRTRMVSVPYAYRIGSVDGATGGTISDKINVGSGNINTGNFSSVFGENNAATGTWSTVAGGLQDSATFTFSTVGGGWLNKSSGSGATVAGGLGNNASGGYAAVAGGNDNIASGNSSTISGGISNRALYDYSAVLGGRENLATSYSTVGGGRYNKARGQFSFVGGGGGISASDSNSAIGDYSFIGGGSKNIAYGVHNTISGGKQNRTFDNYSFVGGGKDNYSDGDYNIICGGDSNRALANYGFVGGGRYNLVSASGGVVVGGGMEAPNLNYGIDGFIGGGSGNGIASIFNYGSAIGGGYYNAVFGDYATIPGGNLNTAAGDYSFAAGAYAKATHNSAFVWSSGADSTFSFGNSTFTARSEGGVRFYTASTGTTTGVRVLAGGGSWASLSDSTQKRRLGKVNTKEILEKVADLPIERWSYKTQDEKIQHIGPMAQDFYKSFRIGDDETTINTVDPDGIALAAIQELAKQNQKLEIRNEKLEEIVYKLQEQVQSLLADKKQTMK